MPTFIRLITGVCANMLLQMGELGEFALADFTSIRLDAEVNACVLREIRAVGERFSALGTLVWFGFTHMKLRVEL